ncbi:hypothetical protein DL93DRAFT_1112104 [Clavulina sp. PMI_390]|nr:hypothetical protein DL93DRAFT_1112104 [Clavulina sp. PMI_390]
MDPHGSFSSIPSAKSLDEDPTVWVNPSFKGNSRYTTAHVERGLDDARFHDPSRSIRSTSSSAYDFNDETFRFHPPTSGGMYEVGPPMDDLNQGAVQRARSQRDFSPNVPPFPYSSSWLGPRELEEASLVNPFGASDSYSHINASNPDYPYPTPSPYTSLRPDLSPSPANLSSQLPAVNAPYPPPKGMVPSTQRSGSLPIIQAPYNDTYPSQTPLPLPGSMLPPHLTTGSAVVRGESLHDLPHHPGHEHPSYSAPFETYMQARRTSLAGPPPTSTSTGSLSPESGARSVQRPAGPAHHEVRVLLFFCNHIPPADSSLSF